MFKIHDPLGLIEQNPELKRRVTFFKTVVLPICLFLIVVPIVMTAIVVMIEAIKYG